MKLLFIALTLSISAVSFAQTAKLGQDSDPVAGDNSRCCRTGKCGDHMKLCADTQIDADRAPKDVYVSQRNKKNKSSKASAQ
jgi:Spy/CpxP family protein refolding chaperone